MSQSLDGGPKEGLKIFRLFMVFGSMSPLFILWAIRGNNLLSDHWFIPVCVLMVIIPNGAIWIRLLVARKQEDKRPVAVGDSEDHRVHLLVYLFSILLPFYRQEFETWRDLSAMFAALAFIVFLFWHLNLHYMNLFFAIFGYRIFTVNPLSDGNPYTSKNSFVIITRRRILHQGEQIMALRLSNLVYWEQYT